MTDFAWPVSEAYKQRDKSPGDTVRFGDYWRVNWLGHQYNLLGAPSVHEGDDLVRLGVSCYGDPVYAIAAGKVIYAEKVFNTSHQPSSWGKLVVIQHALDTTTIYSRYAHLKEMLVQAGDAVTCGQEIGTIGNADGMLPPHLHFSICLTDRNLTRPTDWPSSGHSAAEALAIIQANYTDPLFYLRRNMNAVSNPDTALAMWIALAKLPRGIEVRVIPSLPPPREPLEDEVCYVVTVGDMYKPPAPPAPVKMYVTRPELNIRSLPTTLGSTILKVLKYGDEVTVQPPIANQWVIITAPVAGYCYAPYLSLTRPNP